MAKKSIPEMTYFVSSGTLSINSVSQSISSRTVLVSQHQKGRTILDFNEARDDGAAVASAGLYANHLHLAADDNHTSTPSLSFYRPDAPFMLPNQQHQITEGK